MSLEAVQTEKKALVANSQKIGPLYIKGNIVNTWTKKTAVLSGRYLYIFASPKDQ
jgi:vacuolar protein sorting-associated protein 13A/C